MKRFLHNCKGAVTVMVTLLLIPAILVSGTGVALQNRGHDFSLSWPLIPSWPATRPCSMICTASSAL